MEQPRESIRAEAGKILAKRTTNKTIEEHKEEQAKPHQQQSEMPEERGDEAKEYNLEEE